MKILLALFALLFFVGCTLDNGVKNRNITYKKLTEDELDYKVKDNPQHFVVNEKYWIALNVGQIDKKQITVLSNNGRIFNSKIEGYDFMFIPERIGKLLIDIYAFKDGENILCSEMEIKITDNSKE
jgi:hypothetical protein